MYHSILSNHIYSIQAPAHITLILHHNNYSFIPKLYWYDLFVYMHTYTTMRRVYDQFLVLVLNKHQFLNHNRFNNTTTHYQSNAFIRVQLINTSPAFSSSRINCLLLLSEPEAISKHIRQHDSFGQRKNIVLYKITCFIIIK